MNPKKYITILTLAILSIPFAASAMQAPDGDLSSRGWAVGFSENIVGTNECNTGAGTTLYDVEVKELNTEDASVSVDEIGVYVYDNNTNELVDSSVDTNAELSSGVCFDQSLHYIVVDVDGGSSYYDFYTAYEYTGGSDFSERHIRGHVHVRETASNDYDTQWITPRGDASSFAFISNLADYEFGVNHLLDVHGVGGDVGDVYSRNFIIQNQTTGVTEYSNETAVSGGVGTYTIPAVSLDEGYYIFNLYVQADGTGGQSNNPLSHLQRSYVLVDTTNPSEAGSGITYAPSQPTDQDTVEISATMQDTLSGLANTTIYLDDTAVGECLYNGTTSSQTCTVTVGPFEAGTDHVYTATAIDRAGNTYHGQAKTFSVEGNTPLPSILFSASPETVVYGDPTELSWNTSYANSCEASNDWSGAKALTGTETIQPVNEAMYFTLECTGDGGTSAAYTSVSVTECSDRTDNDDDGLMDDDDPGCFTDPTDPNTYDASDDSEADPHCFDEVDNDKDGLVDQDDPGCWSTPGSSTSYDPAIDSENSCGNNFCDAGSGESYINCSEDCPFEFREQ